MDENGSSLLPAHGWGRTLPPELEPCTNVQLSILTGGWKDGTALSLVRRPYYVLIIRWRRTVSLFFSFSEKYLLFEEKQPFAFKPFLRLESLLRIHFPSPRCGHCVVGTEKTQAVTGCNRRNITIDCLSVVPYMEFCVLGKCHAECPRCVPKATPPCLEESQGLSMALAWED